MLYRRYSIPSIWEEMDRIERQMNRALQRGMGRRWMGTPTYPALNVWLNDEGAYLTAEMPGVDSSTLDIKVTGETLTISGERPEEPMPEGACCQRQERSFGQFSRTIELPFAVQANNVEARMEKGVLHMRLPRAEADKPRQIAVK